MAVLRTVPLVVICTVLILVSHTGMTTARSVRPQRGHWSQLLTKRNSWWSKKSVDASSDFRGIVPDSSLDESLAENNADGNTDLFVCYMSSCVPDFTACAAHSRTAGAFEDCRFQHRQCAMRCLQVTMTQDQVSAMK